MHFGICTCERQYLLPKAFVPIVSPQAPTSKVSVHPLDPKYVSQLMVVNGAPQPRSFTMLSQTGHDRKSNYRKHYCHDTI